MTRYDKIINGCVQSDGGHLLRSPDSGHFEYSPRW
jgi:hypothetical protein